MVIPNQRRATTSDAFLGATRRAGLFFPLAVLSIACVEPLHIAHEALREEKIDTSRRFLICVNRPLGLIAKYCDHVA